MPFIDVKIFCASTAEYDVKNQVHHTPLYDIDDGSFWFNAQIPKRLYETAMQNQNPKKPSHVFITGELVDVVIDQDFLGPVRESRQRMDLSAFHILPSDICVPENLTTTFTPLIKPFSFTPGPQEGYYLVLMDLKNESKFYPKTLDTVIDDDDDMVDDDRLQPTETLEDPSEFDKAIIEQIQQDMERAQGGSSPTNPFILPTSFFGDLILGGPSSSSAPPVSSTIPPIPSTTPTQASRKSEKERNRNSLTFNTIGLQPSKYFGGGGFSVCQR